MPCKRLSESFGSTKSKEKSEKSNRERRECQTLNIFFEETADKFERYVISYFGLSSILHTDNGQEFKNKVMSALLSQCDGNIKHKCGDPVHLAFKAQQNNQMVQTKKKTGIN